MPSNTEQNNTHMPMNTVTEKTLKIKLVKTEFQGFFKVQSLLFKHSLYQGDCSPEIKRELFCRGEAVVVLLYDSSLNQIVLVEQCRPGGCDEILHLYAADICANEVSELAGLADDHEDIRVIKLAFTDAKRMLLNAEFNVASTYIALQWLFFQKLAVQPLD